MSRRSRPAKMFRPALPHGSLPIVRDIACTALGLGYGPAEIAEIFNAQIAIVCEEWRGPGFQAGVYLYLDTAVRAQMSRIGYSKPHPDQIAVEAATVGDVMRRPKAYGLDIGTPGMTHEVLSALIPLALDRLYATGLVGRVGEQRLRYYPTAVCPGKWVGAPALLLGAA